MLDQEFIHNWATVFLIIYVIYDLIRNRKIGRTLLGKFVFYSFLYYLINVIKLTLFPIPLDFLKIPVSVQLIPFYFIIDWVNSGYIGRAYIENFILLLPLGLYLPLLFARYKNIKLTVLVAFWVTFSIEFMQLILGFTIGLHRMFNIDDIILNTMGAIVGYAIYKLISVFIKINNNIK
ncbi:VanZ family protein [Bacillus solitudinis]|uniref:VanZ family protein n=1 Tax=Bacillus solitudinis TaxID=2014074 RepID=UPI000C25145F|nr:VanZ family protein [Bacillus solitudinis]